MTIEKKILENPAVSNSKNKTQRDLVNAIWLDAWKESSWIEYKNFWKFTDEILEWDYYLNNYSNNSLVFSWSDFSLNDLDQFWWREIVKSLWENKAIENIIISNLKNQLESQIEAKASANWHSGKWAEYISYINKFWENIWIFKFWHQTKEFLQSQESNWALKEDDIKEIKKISVKWEQIQNQVLNSLDWETKKLIIQTWAFYRYQSGKEVWNWYIWRLPSAEQKILTLSNTFSLNWLETYLNDSKYDELKDALTNIQTKDLDRYLNNWDIIEVNWKKYIDWLKHKKQLLWAIRENSFDWEKKYAFAQIFWLTSQDWYEFLFDWPNSQWEKILDAIFDPDIKSINLDFPWVGSIPLNFWDKNIFLRTKNWSEKASDVSNLSIFFDYHLQPIDPNFASTINDLWVDKKIKFWSHEIFSGYKISAKNELDWKIITGYPRLEIDDDWKEILTLYETHPFATPNANVIGYTSNPNSVNILEKNHSLWYEDMMKFLAILAWYKAFDYLSNDEKSRLMRKFREQNQQQSLENLTWFKTYKQQIEKQNQDEENEKVENDKKLKAQEIFDKDPYYSERTSFWQMLKSKYDELEFENWLPKKWEKFLLDAGIPSLIDSWNQKLILEIDSIDRKTNQMYVRIFGTENKLRWFEWYTIPIFMSINGWSDFLARPWVEGINPISQQVKKIDNRLEFENYINWVNVAGWINNWTRKNLATGPSSGYLVRWESSDIKNLEVVKYNLHWNNVELENMWSGGKKYNLTYLGFLAYISKPFSLLTKSEYEASRYNTKENIPWISKPFKFVSVWAAIWAVKSVFKSWQDYNKKRDELGQAELEQWLFRSLKWIPGMSEVANNSWNSKISSIIDDFKKSFDTNAKLDPGPVFQDILKLVKNPKSSHRYKLKVAWAMLFALDKWWIYTRQLASLSGQWYFVQALLWPAHRQAFLKHSDKIKSEIALWWEKYETNKQKLANAEIDYLNQIVENWWKNASMFTRLFATDFDEKLREWVRKSQWDGLIDEEYKSLTKYWDPEDIFNEAKDALEKQNVWKVLGWLQALVEKLWSSLGRKSFVKLASMIMFSWIWNRFSKNQWETFDKIANSSTYYWMNWATRERSINLQALTIIDDLAILWGAQTTLGSQIDLSKDKIENINDSNYIKWFKDRLEKIENWFWSNSGNAFMKIIDWENSAGVWKIAENYNQNIGAKLFLDSYTWDLTADPKKAFIDNIVKKNPAWPYSWVNHLTKTSNETARETFWTTRTKHIETSWLNFWQAAFTLASNANILTQISPAWNWETWSMIKDYMEDIRDGKISGKVKIARSIKLKDNISKILIWRLWSTSWYNFYDNEIRFRGLAPSAKRWIDSFVKYMEKVSDSTSLSEQEFQKILDWLKIKQAQSDDTMTNDEANKILSPDKYKKMFDEGLDEAA